MLYSLTKYVGGHSDLIAGACLGDEAKLRTAFRNIVANAIESTANPRALYERLTRDIARLMGVHIAARTLATHALSIFGDHQDVMAGGQTGFAKVVLAPKNRFQ